MRVLAIDYGDKRIGLAVSDALRITSQPLKTIPNHNTDQVLQDLADIIAEYQVSLIVLGLPLNMDSSEGCRADISREFKETLNDKFDVPVVLQDERLSSAEVEKILLAGDVSRADRKNQRDKLAASIILQRYLAQIQGGKNNNEQNK